MKFTIRQITQASVIAAAYLVLTLLFAPISFGLIQFRIAEALMLLSAITWAAIPGLFVGCLLANLIGGGLGIVDVLFGSIATLAAAIATYALSKKKMVLPQKIKIFILPVPTILLNGIIVGSYLPFLIPEIRSLSDGFGIVLMISIGSVMLGEAVVTVGLGIPLYLGMKRTGLFPAEERKK
jgi:uncharacterized membrane protein